MPTIAELLLSSNRKSYSDPPNQALRVFTGANLSDFYFRIADHKTRRLIHVDGGSLPNYYTGLRTALVAITCVIQLGSQGQGRGRRWAA